jgi:ribosomal protein S12 methylthiotransferase
MRPIAFITLGCPKNEVDTDRMRAAIVSAGFDVTDDPEGAAAVVVNTCSFIQDATEESISVILDQIEAGGSDTPVVVAGCMPSRYGAELQQEFPEVAAFVPVADEHEIVSVLTRVTGIDSSALKPRTDAPSRTVDGSVAYLQVSDGCHRNCAYCTIPSIRGPYRSRALGQIVAEARELVSSGAKEIVLIGQDITAYGRDLAESYTLAHVVDEVARVEGLARLRLMYAQPDGVTDELLDAMASHANVCRYLDMPLQHSSRAVLRAMRRSGDTQSLLALLERIRTKLPDVVLRTTLIAGFPGETTADVNELVRFLETARFDYVGVFPYSPEDGTDAASMEPQIPKRTRIRRAQKLRDISDAIGFELASARIGDTVEVLVEGVDPDDGFVVGRWCGQAPDIDGLVILDRGEPGQIVSARVVDSLGYDLEAEVLS